MLNVPWTNVKVKNRPRKTGLGFQWVAPGWFFWGCQAPSLSFQGGWALEPIVINGVKWGPPLEMAENQQVTGVIREFWGEVWCFTH